MPPNITYTCSNRELRTFYSNQSYLWAPLIPRTFFLPLDTIVCLPWTFITEPSYLLFWYLNTVIISAPKSFLLKTKYPWFLMVWHNTHLCQKGQIPVMILHGSFSRIIVVVFDYFVYLWCPGKPCIPSGIWPEQKRAVSSSVFEHLSSHPSIPFRTRFDNILHMTLWYTKAFPVV